LRHLARIVESRSYPQGTVISKQGVPADIIIFLKSGTVVLKKVNFIVDDAAVSTVF
jgi:hypothetical protein